MHIFLIGANPVKVPTDRPCPCNMHAVRRHHMCSSQDSVPDIYIFIYASPPEKSCSLDAQDQPKEAHDFERLPPENSPYNPNNPIAYRTVASIFFSIIPI